MAVELNQLKQKLYGENAVAKIWGVAQTRLNDKTPPVMMPEYSFFDEQGYFFRDMEYWTCGFFPGSLYALVERSKKYGSHFPSEKLHSTKLENGARWWAHSLKREAPRTDTHDLGFIIAPVFIREHQLFGTQESKDILVTAANALASRFDETVGCIRSWDTAVNHRYSYTDTTKDFLVIIDNMCNLDLLYYTAQITGDLRLSTIATTHAENTLKNQFRPDWSCYHVVNYNRRNGDVIAKFTNQGYEDESAWSRGQAWAIMGYIDTYGFTGQKKFLDAALNLADFFLGQLPSDGVPAWDFRAPDKKIRDVSAAMIAALGLIKIFEHTQNKEYLEKGLKLVDDSVRFAYNEESLFEEDGNVVLNKFDTILSSSTINNNPHTHKKLVDHGLVYADYYFLTIGNKLLELNILE